MSSVTEALHQSHAANGIKRPGCKLCRTDAVHYVELTAAEPDLHGNRDAPALKFECRGDSTSECHQYPNNCGCESWPCGHPYVSHAKCWMQDWFDGDSASYEGEDGDYMTPGGLPKDVTRAGPITTSWEEEYVAWEWTE
ncbi:hypothetical protein ACIPWF_00675 [Paenarthrobacter sp. NPDC089989]|uniref:hypothetical protein n=1 Tax=unclassified Paenarthrobacter TaxID=2634190 RepID=UPI00382F8AD9